MKRLILVLTLVSHFTFGADKAADKAFGKALVSYEKLHQAFFDNDLSQVHRSANAVLKEVQSIKDEKMVKTLTYTKKKLQALTQVASLEEGKKDFDTISQGLLVVLEKQAPHKKYARYYCPMVKKYWIQNISESEEVMNPYASRMMPHCGEKK